MRRSNWVFLEEVSWISMVFFMRVRTYLLLFWCCCCWLGKGDYANRIRTEHQFRKQSIGEANTELLLRKIEWWQREANRTQVPTISWWGVLKIGWVIIMFLVMLRSWSGMCLVDGQRERWEPKCRENWTYTWKMLSRVAAMKTPCLCQPFTINPRIHKDGGWWNSHDKSSVLTKLLSSTLLIPRYPPSE